MTRRDLLIVQEGFTQGLSKLTSAIENLAIGKPRDSKIDYGDDQDGDGDDGEQADVDDELELYERRRSKRKPKGLTKHRAPAYNEFQASSSPII